MNGKVTALRAHEVTKRMILSGAIPAAVLALFVDGGLALVERGVAPEGVD